MSDFINGLNGINDMYAQNTYDKKTSMLSDKLSSKDYSTASDDELMEACKSFEQYYIEQVIKGMEKTIPKSEDSSSASYYEMFKGKLFEGYAEEIADDHNGAGLGIAQKLYEQMKRNYGL